MKKQKKKEENRKCKQKKQCHMTNTFQILQNKNKNKNWQSTEKTKDSNKLTFINCD